MLLKIRHKEGFETIKIYGLYHAIISGLSKLCNFFFNPFAFFIYVIKLSYFNEKHCLEIVLKRARVDYVKHSVSNDMTRMWQFH